MTKSEAAEFTTEVNHVIDQIVTLISLGKLQFHVKALVALKLDSILSNLRLRAIKYLGFFIQPTSLRCNDHLVPTNKLVELLDQFALGKLFGDSLPVV